MRRTLLLVLVAGVLGPAASAQALTVYAAASLRGAFHAIDSGPSYNFAGSNALQTQIERGAPADVFASASFTEARELFRAGLCMRPRTFATNRLVVLVPRSNPGHVRSVYTLRGGRRRVAVGAAGVPIGDYTRQVLGRMRLSGILRTNTVSQERDVSSITAKVALGSADGGFVYHTDAKASQGRTREIRLPGWAHPPVRYQMCIVRRRGADGRGGQAFIDRVRSTAGRRVLHRYGFGLPPR
jgi:molybdate transport system substrate-binding protein